MAVARVTVEVPLPDGMADSADAVTLATAMALRGLSVVPGRVDESGPVPYGWVTRVDFEDGVEAAAEAPAVARERVRLGPFTRRVGG